MPRASPAGFLNLGLGSLMLLAFASSCIRVEAQDLSYVLVGSYASNITVFQLNFTARTLTFVRRVAAGTSPSFLTVNAAKTKVFATNEANVFSNGSGGLQSFNYSNGDLKLVSNVTSEGAAPCYLSLDSTETYLLATNYGGSNFGAWSVAASGQLGTPSRSLIKVQGQGPTDRQTAPHPHSVIVNNSYIFVSDLGSDKIWQYRLSNGALTPNTAAESVGTGAGVGPRHLKVHPTKPWWYGSNELNSSVSFYKFNKTSGTLQFVMQYSTQLNCQPPVNTTICRPSAGAPSELQVRRTFVYVANRGNLNTLAAFSIDQTTGLLTFIRETPVRGRTPRHFVIMDRLVDGTTKRLCLVANQATNNISIFSANTDTGALTYASGASVSKPSFILPL